MAGFNFFGVPPALDPNSLPALLHRPPGLIPGPIQAPQLGQSPGFRPPPLMSAPQMGMPGMGMPQQQAPGFNMQDGAAMLGAGLAGFRPGVTPSGPQGTAAGGVYTPADAMSMFNGANGGSPMVDAAGFSPAASFVGGAMPGGLTQQDFLTGAWLPKTGLGGP